MLKFSKNNNKVLRFSLLIILLSLSFLILQNVLQKKSIEVNVIDVSEQDLDKFVELSISGNIKGILKSQQNPSTYVTITYLDANLNEVKKTVSLDYSSNFSFDTITVPKGSLIDIVPTSVDYTFFPVDQKFSDQTLPSTVKFEALPNTQKSSNLSIVGQILGTATKDTVVYLYGTSNVSGQTVKKLTTVDKSGFFRLEGVESGVYVVAPVSNKAFSVPKYKTITVKNSDFKVNFALIPRIL